MQFLCIFRLTEHYRDPGNWDEKANQAVGAHFSYLTGLFQQGLISWVGKTELDVTDPDNIGLVVHIAANIEEAKKRIEEDPCIREGLMQYSVLPFRTIFK